MIGLRKKQTAPSFMLMDEVENRFNRLRSRTRYKLPPVKRESFFAAFRRSKVKQQPTDLTERKNKDVINFL